jgi:hypothetical protein
MIVIDEFRRTGSKLAGPAQGIAQKWLHLLPIHLNDFNLILIDQTSISNDHN